MQNTKLWGGRFSKSTNEQVDDFNSSIRFDKRMYRSDIKGSMAHAEMLGKCGIIPKDNAELIVKTLGEILEDIEAGKVEFSVEAEDIHMNVESILISRIGDVGKQLHTGRSRNDQVALDIRMYLIEELTEIKAQIKHLLQTLVNLAKDHTETLMPGYTHLQVAMPSSFGMWLSAYAEALAEFNRLYEHKTRICKQKKGGCNH